MGGLTGAVCIHRGLRGGLGLGLGLAQIVAIEPPAGGLVLVTDIGQDLILPGTQFVGCITFRISAISADGAIIAARPAVGVHLQGRIVGGVVMSHNFHFVTMYKVFRSR